MARLLLVHWRPAEARGGIALLRKAGHVVATYSEQGGVGLKRYRKRPPEAILIDLTRLPSHGRQVAWSFREGKSTRGVPLIFVGGDAGREADARRLLPDAAFSTWRSIRGAVRSAIVHPPANPVVPVSTSGYSDRPLVGKLGIKPGQKILLLDAPPKFEETLGVLPDAARTVRGARGKAAMVLLFTATAAQLERRWEVAVRALAEGGRLWVIWPKKTGGLASDLGGNEVRRHGLERGLVDFKICAVDADWSGLAFVRRKKS